MVFKTLVVPIKQSLATCQPLPRQPRAPCMAPLLLPCPARRQMAQRSDNQLLGSLPQLGFAMTEEKIERKASCSKILKSFRGYPVTFNIKGPGCRLAGEVQNEHIRFASRTDYATVILNNLRLLILLSFKSSAIFPISG